MLLAFFAAKAQHSPVQVGIHREPQVVFCKAAFWWVSCQHVLMHGVVPSQQVKWLFNLLNFMKFQLGIIPTDWKFSFKLVHYFQSLYSRYVVLNITL